MGIEASAVEAAGMQIDRRATIDFVARCRDQIPSRDVRRVAAEHRRGDGETHWFLERDMKWNDLVQWLEVGVQKQKE